MTKLDWRTVQLKKGILREPTPDETRIILWLPGTVIDGYRHWERITNVAGAEIAEEQGICFTQATALPARQKLSGFFGKLLGNLRKPAGKSIWMLPSGGYTEQTGDRQTGLLLTWGTEESAPVDETRLQGRWGSGHQLRKIGPNLFLVVPAQGGPGTAAPAALLGNPKEQVETLLAAARQSSDRRAEASALIDLGIALMRGGESHRALVVLEEGLSLGRKLKDKQTENDALANLGLALLAVGQPERAQELLGQALASVRELGDRFEEKTVLANLGTVLAGRRDFAEALVATDHALKVARELGDRAHEAELLWFEAILNADLGRHETACILAQSAIDIHATLRSPHVGWLTSHLKKYRPNITQTKTGSAVAGRHPGGYYTGPATALATPTMAIGSTYDPAVLRTALSAVKSLTSTSAAGMKTVTAEVYQRRLETCVSCPHHTGARCRPCGDFTRAKAWFVHEHCPVGKWGA